jgi:hypothetical protein
LAREIVERRLEVAKRLGFTAGASHPGDGEMPLDRLKLAARALLATTRDLRDAMWRGLPEHRAAVTPRERLAVCIGEALAKDAGDGWPARLTTHWLESNFREMCRDTRLALELPRVAGASSFARGLYRLGFQLRAGGRNPLPFSVAKSPEMTDAHRVGSVFGALAMTRVFQKKVLGLSDRIAARQARALARTAFLEAVLLAGRWLLSQEEPASSRTLWQDVVQDVFGGSIDARFCGAWPAQRVDETARFEGLLGTYRFESLLVSRFDDDWFKNPRAGAFFRARAAGPARIGALEPAVATLSASQEARPDPVDLAIEIGRFFEKVLG